MTEEMKTEELFSRYVVPSYGRFDLNLDRGQGCRVWDEDGTEYLDFACGIAVCCLGHAHPRMSKALAEQSARLVHTSNLYYTRSQGELAKRLVDCVGHPGKIFFCNSGGEANEALYKLARKYGNTSEPAENVAAPKAGRVEIVACENSFHGRTLAGIAATGQPKVKNGFEPMMPGFRHVSYNDSEALAAAVDSSTAAVLIEPIQGEGGIVPSDPSYLKAAREICDEAGALLMFDEVQCGLGRTGEWCGWKSIEPGIVPDAVSWAKGIAGGFPFGAVWIRDREIALRDGGADLLSRVLGPGTHATTYGGNPLGCSVAMAVFDVVEEEGLLRNAARQGRYALEVLSGLDTALVRGARGVGLLIGIRLAEDFYGQLSAGNRTDTPASIFLAKELLKEGLLVVPAGPNVIRWLPPLNVQREEIDLAAEKMRSVFARLEGKES